MNDAEELRARLARAERRLRWLYAVLAVAGGAWIVTAAGGLVTNR